jgi:hypothetical protein
VSRPVSIRWLSSMEWWITSKLPPRSGYSRDSELKQCGHEATTFLAPASFRVTMLAFPISW